MKRKITLLAALLSTTLAFAQDATAPAAPAATAPTSKTVKGSGQSTTAMKSLPHIDLSVQSINGVTTWVLANPTVEAGHTYLLVAHHDLKTGPAEHGLQIDEFKIKTIVHRGVEYKALVKVPEAAKGKTIKITCFLHPKHKEALLTVK